MKALYFLIISCLIFGACVPNKKIVFLQSEDEMRRDFPTDTVLRYYDLANYEYRIQPEDILSIRIESLTEDEYNIFASQRSNIGANQNNQALGGYLVDKNGEIQFPEVGKVRVGGLTIHEIEEKINVIARRYITEPASKVRLLNFRVSIIGEVNSVGVFNSFDNRVTIMEAISSNGGLSEMADRSQVKIIRQNNGRAEILYVNLLEENYLNYNSFFLHPNDIIVVPPLKQRPFRKYFGQNLSLFVSTVSVVLLTINLLTN